MVMEPLIQSCTLQTPYVCKSGIVSKPFCNCKRGDPFIPSHPPYFYKCKDKYIKNMNYNKLIKCHSYIIYNDHSKKFPSFIFVFYVDYHTGTVVPTTRTLRSRRKYDELFSVDLSYIYIYVPSKPLLVNVYWVTVSWSSVKVQSHFVIHHVLSRKSFFVYINLGETDIECMYTCVSVYK